MMDSATSLRIAARLEHLNDIRRFVQETAAALGSDAEGVADVLLAVTEAATNVIVHGYGDQAGFIEIVVDQVGDALVICLRDQATQFDPTSLPAPDLSLPLEQRPLGGLGVYIMTSVMDEVSYSALPGGGNQLTMVKRGVMQDNSRNV
ncbi:MAG: ATP-binding protein [Anaerolineae bacterium]